MSALDELELTKQEVARDLAVFRHAHDMIKDRVLRSRTDGRLPDLRLEHWAGTQTVIGALTLCLNTQERVLEDLALMIQQAGESYDG